MFEWRASPSPWHSPDHRSASWAPGIVLAAKIGGGKGSSLGPNKDLGNLYQMPWNGNGKPNGFNYTIIIIQYYTVLGMMPP